MSGTRLIIGLILLGVGCGPSHAQELAERPIGLDGSAASANPKSAGPRVETPSMARYKVVFWFDGTTWESQAYDLGRREYTNVVDEWVRRIDLDAHGFVRPGPMATVREICLPESPAGSLKERLAAACREELDRTLRARGDLANKPRPSGANRDPDARLPGRINPEVPRARPAIGRATAPGSGGVPPGALARPFPFPYPYPRPHP